MRGEILTYDDGPGSGLISGDDGNRYAFSRSDLQQLTPVRAGTRVDFMVEGDRATQVFVTGAARPVGPGAGVAGSATSFDWRKLFLQADGRIGQKDYWIGFGIVFAVNLVFSWLPLIGILISLAAIYAGVCVSSKRLHDMGRSGWLSAIPYGVFAAATVLSVISFVGIYGAAGFGNEVGAMAGMGLLGLLWMLAAVVNIGFVIWLGITVGEPGDNRYGPPPVSLANF